MKETIVLDREDISRWGHIDTKIEEWKKLKRKIEIMDKEIDVFRYSFWEALEAKHNRDLDHWKVSSDGERIIAPDPEERENGRSKAGLEDIIRSLFK